jgi:hypothetical protein
MFQKEQIKHYVWLSHSPTRGQQLTGTVAGDYAFLFAV